MTKARALQFKREADRRLALRLVSENRREALRKKLKPSLNKREKVMARFYGISTNDYKPIMVEHAVVDRIMNEQGQCGFIVVSAYRNDEPQEVVDKHSCELVSTLKRSGYAYLPTYGRNANANSSEKTKIMCLLSSYSIIIPTCCIMLEIFPYWKSSAKHWQKDMARTASCVSVPMRLLYILEGMARAMNLAGAGQIIWILYS